MSEYRFDSKVFLSPMAGITDRPLRQLTHSFGSGNIISEMVAVNAISRKNAKTYRIADVRDENYPVTVQLVGGEPELFADAVKLIEELGAAGIDINMGCPVKKIVNNNSGSYLMKDVSRAAAIITKARQSTNLPLSVKFRKGWDNNHVNAAEFAKMCEDCGADWITVHGRTRSDMYSGYADWDIIASVKQAVHIPVIGNGDIDSPQKALAMIQHTKVDGVMVGRAALGRPWLIAQIHNFLEQGILPSPPTNDFIKEVMLKHIAGLKEYYGEHTAISLARKYVCWYCKGLRNACRFREKFVLINDIKQAYNSIEEFFSTLEEEEKE
ncbi:MAG: tRNA dihydrouridine synthase DusB [Alphaproteobacteria bacterium]|nr:tRNA dihydrouridine synthase DusB [Alphaproteobacteria bacterium]